MKIFSGYFRILAVNLIVLITLRLFETILILINFGPRDSLFISELAGFCFDLIFTNTFLAIAFPLYFLSCRISYILANSIFISLLTLMTFLHFLILKYFLYQLLPLDTSLYQYTLREIYLTISYSGISYIKTIFLLLLLFSVIIFSFQYLRKQAFSRRLIFSSYTILLLFIPVFILTQFFGIVNHNKFSENKSRFFYSRSLSYFFREKNNLYSEKDAREFQNLFPSNLYKCTEFPILHDFDTTNIFRPFFNEFDSAPNIVILIIEGLNDDFIHSYRGVELLPFLDKLKNESLYWNKCFALGERSFAVVPSIIGSLPYGRTGFTLLDKIPRHFSLVSILKRNNYYTSFFYGQGSWFHRKDRFFNFNDIDLIFDNSRFDEKYKKIITGNDNFFWGYNDYDLFNQSFEVLDSLPVKNRLDIYFTGSTHSPFTISDSELYDKKFSSIISLLKNEDDIEFFRANKKYIQSILFLNNSLEDFFNNYKKRPDFENTIFIITGDHPMTEMPIANALKKYHVPLLIFSPRLKEGKTFSQIVSHLDIYESVLALLKSYNIRIPEFSTALGNKLNVNGKRDVKIAFMNDNREIIDFLSNEYFLSGDNLYLVNKDLSLAVSSNPNIKAKIQQEIKLFNRTNLYVSSNDKILPDSLYCKNLNYNLIYSYRNSEPIKFSTEYYNIIDSVKMKNRKLYYDISFDYKSRPDKDFSLVFQFSSENDNVVFWRNTGVEYDNKKFQAHFIIPQQNTSESILYLKSFFWNKNKQDFSLSKLNILIYD